MRHLKFDESGSCASIKDIDFMSGGTRAAFGDAEALCIQENLKLFNVRTHRTNAEIAIEAEFNRSSLLIYSACHDWINGRAHRGRCRFGVSVSRAAGRRGMLIFLRLILIFPETWLLKSASQVGSSVQKFCGLSFPKRSLSSIHTTNPT